MQRKCRKHGLGMAIYARLLSALRAPMTAMQLTDADIATRGTVRRFLRSAHRMGWAHIVGWQMEHRSLPVEVWAFGHGVDAPYPTHRPSGEPVRSRPFTIKPAPILTELLSFFSLLEELRAGPSSSAELAAAVGISETTAYHAVRQLKAAKLVRIARWPNKPTSGGRPEPIFAFGCGNDAPRPKPKDRKAINKTYTERRNMLRTVSILRTAMAGNSPSFAQQA